MSLFIMFHARCGDCPWDILQHAWDSLMKLCHLVVKPCLNPAKDRCINTCHLRLCNSANYALVTRLYWKSLVPRLGLAIGGMHEDRPPPVNYSTVNGLKLGKGALYLMKMKINTESMLCIFNVWEDYIGSRYKNCKYPLTACDDRVYMEYTTQPWFTCIYAISVHK